MQLNKYVKILILLFIVLSIVLTYYLIKINKNSNWFIGGLVNSRIVSEKGIYKVNNVNEDYSEIYQRPSKSIAINNEVTFDNFNEKNIKNSEDLIMAYYGVLKEASNMLDYSGGCGTIGNATTPYQVAYNLLSSEYQKHISMKKFIDSFKGIGHISLLNIYPLSNNNENAEYLVEIEYITGKYKGEQDLSYFGYNYGKIQTIKENNIWKIKSITYYPENFLCAPYHNWFYDAEAVISIVYIDNLKVIDKITDNKSEDNSIIYIYGVRGKDKYRFDFVKLTNGYDILIKENIMKNNQYTPISIIDKTDWEYLKFK